MADITQTTPMFLPVHGENTEKTNCCQVKKKKSPFLFLLLDIFSTNKGCEVVQKKQEEALTIKSCIGWKMVPRDLKSEETP